MKLIDRFAAWACRLPPRWGWAVAYGLMTLNAVLWGVLGWSLAECPFGHEPCVMPHLPIAPEWSAALFAVSSICRSRHVYREARLAREQ